MRGQGRDQAEASAFPAGELEGPSGQMHESVEAIIISSSESEARAYEGPVGEGTIPTNRGEDIADDEMQHDDGLHMDDADDGVNSMWVDLHHEFQFD